MSGAPNSGPVVAQWTVSSTARATNLQLGFVPDYVEAILNHGATNPDFLYWFNKGGQTLPASQQVGGISAAPSLFSQWLDADDHLILTGSSGVVTRVTTGIAVYFGGDLIAADETVDSNPVHPYADGSFPKAGEITLPGILLPAAVLTASGKCLVKAFRFCAAVKPANL